MPKPSAKRAAGPKAAPPQSIGPSYLITHHLGHGPVIFKAVCAPEIKGGFVHFIDSQGFKRWLSGNVMIVEDRA